MKKIILTLLTVAAFANAAHAFEPKEAKHVYLANTYRHNYYGMTGTLIQRVGNDYREAWIIQVPTVANPQKVKGKKVDYATAKMYFSCSTNETAAGQTTLFDKHGSILGYDTASTWAEQAPGTAGYQMLELLCNVDINGDN
jgi:hypothetical protein